MVYDYVNENSFLPAAYTLVGIVSACFIARAALRIWQRKHNLVEDGILLLAYIFFLSLSVLYIVAASELYKATQDADSAHLPWNRSSSLDARAIFFANNLLFWLCVWTVKFLVLAVCRRHISQISDNKSLITSYWMLLALCGLTLAGAVISNFTSCHNWHAFWLAHACSTNEDERAQEASLFYTLAADVLTNLILIILVLNLGSYQKTLASRRKVLALSVILLGTLWTLVAFLRAIVGSDPKLSTKVPSASWLALWSVVEAGTATVIGCLPGIYVALPVRPMNDTSSGPAAQQHHRRFNSRGYEKHQAISNTTGSIMSSDDAHIEAIRGHSRITSINNEIVGSTPFMGRGVDSNAGTDFSRPRHVPIQLPSTFHDSLHRHNRSLSLSSNPFNKETDSLPTSSHHRRGTSSISTNNPAPMAPVVTSPAVSRRTSKASMKYTPIQIPGTATHRRDRGGSLSGAFWGEDLEKMAKGERLELEERAREVKIQVVDRRVVSTRDGRVLEGGEGPGLGV